MATSLLTKRKQTMDKHRENGKENTQKTRKRILQKLSPHHKILTSNPQQTKHRNKDNKETKSPSQ